ncbi:MAG: hypothetical protein KDC10_09385, partial [Calditrichaeota bacterium]|nr:hypothetical protein [Calditrichota bacterium]
MKLLIALVIALVVTTSKAEYRIDIDPTFLPTGHGAPTCVAHIGFVAPGTAYNAVMSGPSGFPEMYHAVWTNDGQIFSPTPINSIDMSFDCNGQMVTYNVGFQPFSTFYLPGPANPPAGPTNFGVDSSAYCGWPFTVDCPAPVAPVNCMMDSGIATGYGASQAIPIGTEYGCFQSDGNTNQYSDPNVWYPSGFPFTTHDDFDYYHDGGEESCSGWVTWYVDTTFVGIGGQSTWYSLNLETPSNIAVYLDASYEFPGITILDESLNQLSADFSCYEEMQVDVGMYYIVVSGLNYWRQGLHCSWSEELCMSHFCDDLDTQPRFTGGPFNLTVSVDPWHLFYSTFNNDGSDAPGWTTQSQSNARTIPWTPVQEAGEDWAVESSHTAFDPVFDEWLISPVYDLTWFQSITMWFTQNYVHAGSSAAVRYSINGGVSWNTLQTFTTTTSGAFSADVSSWADGNANVRFAFRFVASAPTGGSSWRIDDFFLEGIPAPPHADTPLPSQPPAIWYSTSGVIGCAWHHPQTVSGSDLEVRIDSNDDGDYLDGGQEDWTALPDQPDETDLQVQTATIFATDGQFQFEFRAKSGIGNWGYSGTGGVEGIADDWFVIVNADLDPPVFSDYLPTGQPNPLWTASHSFNLGATIVDSGSSVDASSLAWRIDWNHNGIFDGPLEDWTTLTGYTSGPQIIVAETLQLTEDGQYRVQFRAADAAGNMSSSDMVLVRADTTPPTVSNLFTSGASNNAVELIFSLATDLSFQAYEVHVSTDAQVTLDDPIWGPQQDPDLNNRLTSVTTVSGLQPGTGYWFKLWARDLVGNVNVGSNVVQKVTGGTPLAAVQDL